MQCGALMSRCEGPVPDAVIKKCQSAETRAACGALGEDCREVVGHVADGKRPDGTTCFHPTVSGANVFVRCEAASRRILNGTVGHAIDPRTGQCLMFNSVSNIPAGWVECRDVRPEC